MKTLLYVFLLLLFFVGMGAFVLALCNKTTHQYENDEAQVCALVSSGGGELNSVFPLPNGKPDGRKHYFYPSTKPAQAVLNTATQLASELKLPLTDFEVKRVSTNPGLCYYHFALGYGK